MLGPFIKEVESACRAALGTIGFVRKGYLYVRDVSDEVIGSVGLNRSVDSENRLVRINPVMAVRHVALEERLDSIRGIPPKRGRNKPVTIAKPIGYLMPEANYITWKFHDGTNPSPIAEEIAQAVEDYGIRFFEENRSLQQVYQALATRRYRGIEQHEAYRRPVAAWMLGMPDAAKAHLAEYLERLEERSGFQRAERVPLRRELGVAFKLAKPANDGALREYSEFAERLIELMDEGDDLSQ